MPLQRHHLSHIVQSKVDEKQEKSVFTFSVGEDFYIYRYEHFKPLIGVIDRSKVYHQFIIFYCYVVLIWVSV